jgi:hypothetical protein
MAKEPSFQLKVAWKAILMFVALNLTLSFGIAGWLTFRGKKQQERIDATMTDQLTVFQQSISNRIVAEFETARIRETISEVASNQATKLLLSQIQPEVAAFKSEVAFRLASASEEIQALTNATRLSMTILAAQANNRASFDQLRQWAEDPTNSASEICRQIVVSIMDLHNGRDIDPMVPQYYPPWGTDSDPKWDFKKINFTYWELASSQPPQRRIGLLQALWKREDISRSNKLAFTVEVLKKEGDLQAVSAAGYLFRQSSGFNMKTLAIRDFLDWWNRNSGTVTN